MPPREEVRGYRDALNWIHTDASSIPVSQQTTMGLHRMCRGDIWDAGEFKEKDGDIIEKYPDGRVRVRFRTVPAADTPAAVAELDALWTDCLTERWMHPLIGAAGHNLDSLCIHPFRDGNGRVSRLLLLLQLYRMGYEVGRYVSLERLIEQNKGRYYETFEQSSQRWHEGEHNPWPYVGYLLFVIKDAYREFERRVGQLKSPRGAQSALVRDAIEGQRSSFRVADLQAACPGVSIDTIRKALKDLQAASQVECLGGGQRAEWRRTGAGV